MADAVDHAAPRLPRSTPYSFPEFYRPSLGVPRYRSMRCWRARRRVFRRRPAIFWRDITLSYREVYSLSCAAAAGLHALGLRKGDTVCLLMLNRPEYMICWMAASMLGLVLSPMNPSYKEREVAYQLEKQ